MQNMFQFGKTAPTDSIVAIDCAATAMIQNVSYYVMIMLIRINW